jgi:hypothetical protein
MSLSAEPYLLGRMNLDGNSAVVVGSAR